MRMMFDDPVYQEVVGSGTREGLSSDELRRDLYINLLLNWWRTRWEWNGRRVGIAAALGAGAAAGMAWHRLVRRSQTR